jgi:branched-chain amino acid transport system permease protein
MMLPFAIEVNALASAEFWIGAGTVAGIYAIFTLGLQLNIGQTGILNFGQAGFMALGAYAMAILVVKAGWSPWVALPVATLVAVLGGLVVGLPSLRLRGDYFAIATLAAAQILVVVAQNARGLTGGNNGLSGFNDQWTDVQRSILDALEVVNMDDQYSLPLFLITWALFVVLMGGLMALQRTPWGRVLRAVREDEDAAAALGKNVLAYKLQSLAISAALGAVAGYLLALNISLVYPSTFDADFTFIGMAILLLGGLGSYAGVAVSAVLLWTVLEATRFIDLPMASDRVAALRLLLVGLVLILIAMFRPQGLLGRREEMVLRD